MASKKKTKAITRRKPPILNATLYAYVEKQNAMYAHRQSGKYGSYSNYVNYLIAKDSGSKASMKRSLQIASSEPTIRVVRASKKKTSKKSKKAPAKKAKRSIKKAAKAATSAPQAQAA